MEFLNIQPNTKKLILTGAALCLFAGIAAAMHFSNRTLSEQELLMRANVEALAENEGLPVDVLLRHCHWAKHQQCDVVYGGYIWGNSNMAKN